MANIGKKRLEFPNSYGKIGETKVSPGSQTGLTGDQKFSLILAVSIGFGVASLISMIVMLSSWWQFANNSFNDYSKVIREYNDKRYDMLESRIKRIEDTIASQSGKLKRKNYLLKTIN